jgi:NarL family two-component system response regulator LiaR
MNATEQPGRADAPRVVLVDDDQASRVAARAGLQAAGIVVIADAEDRREAVDLCVHFRPDVAVIDADLPGTDGIALTRAITKRLDDVRVILLTTGPDDDVAIVGLRAGATGHVLKDAPAAELADAVRRVADGEPVLSPGVALQLIDRLRALPDHGLGMRPVRSALTARQWEVLDLLCAGLSVDEVADRLVISPQTARTHVKHILRRFGVRSQIDAIRVAGEMRARFSPEQPAGRDD